MPRRSVTKKQAFVAIPTENEDLNAPKVKCYSVEEYKAMLEDESKRYEHDWWNENQAYFEKLRGE